MLGVLVFAGVLTNRQDKFSSGTELATDPDPSGPVAPINFAAGSLANPDPKSYSYSNSDGPATALEDDDFSHGENAVFHGHGDQVCASGCSASRHPTDRLSKREYQRLINQVTTEAMSAQSNKSAASAESHPADSSLALDTLLFYGRQTSKMIQRYGTFELPVTVAESLKRELKYTHALLSIRVVDEAGETRSWLAPTKVPFDRRHVFSMEAKRLQPLVTSGTVKRVGRDHLWTRL